MKPNSVLTSSVIISEIRLEKTPVFKYSQIVIRIHFLTASGMRHWFLSGNHTHRVCPQKPLEFLQHGHLLHGSLFQVFQVRKSKGVSLASLLIK